MGVVDEVETLDHAPDHHAVVAVTVVATVEAAAAEEAVVATVHMGDVGHARHLIELDTVSRLTTYHHDSAGRT